MEFILKANPQIRKHSYRFGVIALLSLVLVHLLSYGQLPFSPGYHFPALSFLIIFGFGAVICTTNYFISDRMNFKTGSRSQMLVKGSVIHMIITSILFTLLYLAVFIGYFGLSFNLVSYLKYLFISNVIILFEYVLLHALREPDPPARSLSSLVLNTGTRKVNVDFDDIALVYSKSGVITFFLNSGERYLSQFNALDELENILPGDFFFRLNRQSMVHRNSIHSYRNDLNRKLLVKLNGLSNGFSDKEFRVSRYKNREFRNWLNGS